MDEAYKRSRFNFIYKRAADQHVIYNTFSKAIVLLSEEEFFARVDNGRQQIKDGLGIEMLPNESLTDFLERVG